jgi:hypothetical protein
MKVFPPLVPIALSTADPGSLVIYEKSLAFVTSVAGQGTARTLAIFNGANRKFTHASALAVHELVLRVGGEVMTLYLGRAHHLPLWEYSGVALAAHDNGPI